MIKKYRKYLVILNFGAESPVKKQKEKGYQGQTVFLRLIDHHFDNIHGFVIDPMHQIFLGVVKKITKLWLDPEFKANEWNVSKHLEAIDRDFLNIRVPHDFGRKPRSLEKNMGHFKGNSDHFQYIYGVL